MRVTSIIVAWALVAFPFAPVRPASGEPSVTLPRTASPSHSPRSFCVSDYGAAGDGKADDSAAFQKAIDAIAAAGKGTLYVPAGDYRIGRLVSAELTSAGITIAGDGPGVSNLLCDNSSGVLRLHDERCLWHVNIKDLAFYAKRPGAGVALEVSSPPRGVRNYRTLLVENVEIRGEGLPTRSYFNTGIKALAQWRPLFMNVIVGGVLDPSLKEEGDAQSDDSLFYKPVCGIQADFCYAPSFQHCYVWSAQTGYRIVSLGRAEGPEDCAFYRSNAVGCRVGIDIDTPIMEPQLVIESCHINCRDVGVRVSHRKFFQITGNLFYSHGKQEFPYTDILLTDCYGGVITGNIFHSVARDNMRPSPPSGRTMIRVAGKSHDLVIAENIFNAKGTVMVADKETTGILSANNHYSNRHAVGLPKL